MNSSEKVECTIRQPRSGGTGKRRHVIAGKAEVVESESRQGRHPRYDTDSGGTTHVPSPLR